MIAAVPSWIVDSLPGVVVAILALAAWVIQGRAVSKAGLAGDKSGSDTPTHSIWRGQSARSVAETAANSAVAIQVRLEQLISDTESERKVTQAEHERLLERIARLENENEQLRKLVTMTDWGKDLVKTIEAHHKAVMDRLSALEGAR